MRSDLSFHCSLWQPHWGAGAVWRRLQLPPNIKEEKLWNPSVLRSATASLGEDILDSSLGRMVTAWATLHKSPSSLGLRVLSKMNALDQLRTRLCSRMRVSDSGPPGNMQEM